MTDRQVTRLVVEDAVEGPFERLDQFGISLQRKCVNQLQSPIGPAHGLEWPIPEVENKGIACTSPVVRRGCAFQTTWNPKHPHGAGIRSSDA